MISQVILRWMQISHVWLVWALQSGWITKKSSEGVWNVIKNETFPPKGAMFYQGGALSSPKGCHNLKKWLNILYKCMTKSHVWHVWSPKSGRLTQMMLKSCIRVQIESQSHKSALMLIWHMNVQHNLSIVVVDFFSNFNLHKTTPSAWMNMYYTP
jgi:hypothetical protein